MNNFWEHYGKSYLAFSQHCDNSDWRKILESIAEEVMKIKTDRPLSFLDVGSGTGKNIIEILEILLSETNRVNALDVVEPSKKAVVIMTHSLLKSSEGGFLRNIFIDISDIRDKKYDVIVFMHSSYYLKNFNDIVHDLFRNNLNDGGKIIVLLLNSKSPFFLNKPELILPNTSDSFKAFLKEGRIDFRATRMNSKFHLSGNGNANVNSFSYFYDFMTQRKIKFDEFKMLLKNSGTKGKLNFRDEMIVLTK